jgi:hypothetical protein
MRDARHKCCMTSAVTYTVCCCMCRIVYLQFSYGRALQATTLKVRGSLDAQYMSL